MSYTPATVANLFLAKAAQEGKTLTPMQVIKLVYIAHGWHLGYFSEPLINEPVQAWKFGPVIETLYHALKKYGNSAVTQSIPVQLESGAMISNSDSAALVDHVWRRYSPFNGMQLSTLTHQLGTPWYKAWHERSGWNSGSEVIPNHEIQAHYEQLIAQPRAG